MCLQQLFKHHDIVLTNYPLWNNRQSFLKEHWFVLAKLLVILALIVYSFFSFAPY